MQNYRNRLNVALRISLGLVFLWFGALKLFGYNPVYELVYASFPWFAHGLGNLILGAGEALIGLGLLTNVFPKFTHAVLLLHLAGTFTVFITGPELMFSPYFPVLTLSGEFVFKNVVLAMAGLVVLTQRKK
mgnify:CR=1 FL=1